MAARGLAERVEASGCPHTGGGGREQVDRAVRRLDQLACVHVVDTIPAVVDPCGERTVEVVLEGAVVPPRVLVVFAEGGLELRPGGSGTRGVPIPAVLVAEA